MKPKNRKTETSSLERGSRQAGKKAKKTARRGLDEVDERERLDGLHLLVAHVHHVRDLGLLGGPLEHLLLCSRRGDRTGIGTVGGGGSNEGCGGGFREREQHKLDFRLCKLVYNK